MPEGRESKFRFLRASSMIKKYKPEKSKSMTSYAFDILSNVALGPKTKWSVVYDVMDYRVYFKTFSNPQLRYFDFNSFDLSCAAPVKVLDINADMKGDVTMEFQDYTQETNHGLIMNTYKKTPNLSNVPERALKQMAMYPENTLCNQ